MNPTPNRIDPEQSAPQRPGAVADSARGGDTPVDLRLIRFALSRRWHWIAVSAVVATIGTFVASLSLTMKYKAQAQVLVQEAVAVNPFLGDLTVEWTARNRLPVIETVLRSRPVLERVLRQMGELSDAVTPETADEQIRRFRQQVSVFATGGGVVSIDMSDRDPDRVYRAVDLLVKAFVDEMLRPQKQALDGASEFLKGQLERTRVDLAQLEDQLQTFKEEHAAELPDVFKVNLDSFLATQRALLEAETELKAKSEQKTALEQHLASYDPVRQSMEGELVDAEVRLNKLRATLTDSHPDVVALAARVREMNARLAVARRKPQGFNLSRLESAARVVPGLEATTGDAAGIVSTRVADLMTGELLQYKALTGDLIALESKVTALRERSGSSLESVRSFAGLERTLNGYMRDYEVKHKVYVGLLEKYEDSRVTRELSLYDEKNQVWVIEAPSRPTRPTGAPLPVRLVGGLFAGIVLGLVVVLASEFMGRDVRSAAEAQRSTGLDVIGTLPRLN
jgi:polysaccharide chain length determinant protein (PEP-CTERM system associated)